MLFTQFLAAAALLLSPFVSAEVKSANAALAVAGKKPVSKACSSALAQIAYGPMTPARAYLARIATELKATIQIILNQVAVGDYGILGNFLQKYGVEVTINSFFNTPFTFSITSAGITASSPFVNTFSQTDANLALNLESFRYDANSGNYFYGFVVISDSTAAGAVVTIILPASTSGVFAPAGC